MYLSFSQIVTFFYFIYIIMSDVFFTYIYTFICLLFIGNNFFCSISRRKVLHNMYNSSLPYNYSLYMIENSLLVHTNAAIQNKYLENFAHMPYATLSGNSFLYALIKIFFFVRLQNNIHNFLIYNVFEFHYLFFYLLVQMFYI